MSIEQGDIAAFAAVTRDAQWIHTDARRAAEGPFGVPIAHGYLVLSLCTWFVDQSLEVSDATTAINYGVDRVRFTSPVHVDSRVRGAVDLVDAKDIGDGVQVVLRVTVEIEEISKPGCVAEVVVRYLR